MAAEPGPITLEAPPGAWPLRLVWDPAITVAGARDEPVAPGRSAWRAEADPDWERTEALLLVSALFEDGHALALAALRPAGASGHDRDQVLHRLESSGDLVEVTEALLSSEYDADSYLRRIGIELWIDPESPPRRVAGDREGEVQVDRGGNPRRELVAMSFRLDGTQGFGACELVRPA
jgi:hypothetical protein